jgi:hypothetical protein
VAASEAWFAAFAAPTVLAPRPELALDAFDVLAEPLQARSLLAQRLEHHRGQRVLEARQRLRQLRHHLLPAHRKNHTKLGEQPVQLIDLHRAHLHQLLARCIISTACCCSVLTATKRRSGRCAASQIACASAASVLLRRAKHGSQLLPRLQQPPWFAASAAPTATTVVRGFRRSYIDHRAPRLL